MGKAKKAKRDSPKEVDQIEYINNNGAAQLVIPVGPRFQAVVPNDIGSNNDKIEDNAVDNLDDSRWLGTRTWPNSQDNPETGTSDNNIGKGRPESCTCDSPGSFECVNRHIADTREKLKHDLGPAFDEWRFDTMGEQVSESWTPGQQNKFNLLVRMNPVSKDRTFLKPALKSFSPKTREEIVNYYLNVYIPRRMGQQTRSGSFSVDTDGEDDDAAKIKDSPKRPRPQNAEGSRYMVGRR